MIDNILKLGAVLVSLVATLGQATGCLVTTILLRASTGGEVSYGQRDRWLAASDACIKAVRGATEEAALAAAELQAELGEEPELGGGARPVGT